MTHEQPSFAMTHLSAAEAVLTAAGIPFTREASALRCVMPGTDAAVAIVSADHVFTAGRPWDETEDAVWSLGDALFPEKLEVPAYLFLVGDPALFDYAGHGVQRDMVEGDRYSPRKLVMTVDELPGWLMPLFAAHAGAVHATPQLLLLRHLQYGVEPPSSATHVFDPRGTLDAFDADPAGGLTEQERGVAGRIYRRVMGTAYHVVWAEAGPNLGRLGNPEGIPHPFASFGERVALAFAVYLAKLGQTAAPGVCLGLHDCFASLDEARCFEAFGCVGEFLGATGASVLVQSEKERVRQVAHAAIHPFLVKAGGIVTKKRSETDA